MRLRFSAILSCMLVLTLATPAHAVRVVTDFPPVHSLVARVMKDLGTPEFIVPPGVSPHHYAMRPSQARTLARAEVIFWVGESLAPWFGRAIEGLAEDARSVELMDAPGVMLLDFPERGGRTGREDRHGDSHSHSHSHSHEGADPHIWLDPENAKAILLVVAETLAQADPENKAAYLANAAAGTAELDALMRQTEEILAPARGGAFVTAHDAYQYFERRFAFSSAGAVASGDAESPTPARMARIQRTIREQNVQCAFIEPQLDDRLLRAAAEGSSARIGVLDPTGERLEPGLSLYPALIKGLARDLASCLSVAE